MFPPPSLLCWDLVSCFTGVIKKDPRTVVVCIMSTQLHTLCVHIFSFPHNRWTCHSLSAKASPFHWLTSSNPRHMFKDHQQLASFFCKIMFFSCLLVFKKLIKCYYFFQFREKKILGLYFALVTGPFFLLLWQASLLNGSIYLLSAVCSSPYFLIRDSFLTPANSSGKISIEFHIANTSVCSYSLSHLSSCQDLTDDHSSLGCFPLDLRTSYFRLFLLFLAPAFQDPFAQCPMPRSSVYPQPLMLAGPGLSLRALYFLHSLSRWSHPIQWFKILSIY